MSTRHATACLLALALAACDGPAAEPAQSSPQSAPSASLPSPDPAPALAPLAWPDPLPAAAADVPTLFKGLLIGTWTPDTPGDFDQAWVDEHGLRSVKGGEHASRRAWHGFTAATPFVPVQQLVAARAGESVAYLYSLVMRASLLDLEPPDVAAALHVRHRGRLRAFYDGRLVLDAPAQPGSAWGEARVPVTLTGPYDVLLLKCGSGSPALGPSPDVEARVSAADGSALAGLTWNSMRPGGLPTDLGAR